MATTKPALMTAEDLWALPDAPGRYELIEGKLLQMPPAGDDHGHIGARIVRRLLNFVDDRDLGLVHQSSTGFVLARNPDTVLDPDVSFTRVERIRPRDASKGFVEGAPDLAVEVISPSNTRREMADKVARLLRAGTSLVWVVDPDRRTVTVHAPDASPRTLREDDTLDGGAILPGFSLPVADIFKRLEPRPTS
jgi:Uma2 family endonuclease